MSELCLFSLVVSPEVGDTITDWLLDHDVVTGFSSYPIAGHGSSEHAMSVAEQVAGHRRQTMFQFYIPCAEVSDLLEGIKRDFRGSGMHYWLVPILESGHVD